ncbi:hypothetical protein ARMGADRAFT_1033960 [Armillaria gallica]|uniref:DUF6589 domain-containing protein n=1 Tax=Armillaria gallica TaxID=47427 RepID=A0A2H3D045_ARMGA|nr:hypothetical protein ARMGADRAFT_1033960 [Armillaria gallica]
MKQCLLDFNGQMGIKGGETLRMLLWPYGDGGTFVTAQHLKKYLGLTDLDVYKNFQNHLFTVELWHAKSTNLNITAANFYGPQTTNNPSALSRCAATTNIAAISIPQQGVCSYSGKPIYLIYRELNNNQSLPSLESLILNVKTLVRQDMESAPNIYRVPVGRQWISHSANESDKKVDKGNQKESPPFKENDGFDGD